MGTHRFTYAEALASVAEEEAAIREVYGPAGGSLHR